MADVVGEVSIPESSQVKEISSPKSYANVVGSRPSLSKFDVAVSVIDGKAMVAVPDEILDDSMLLWEDFLIGRFPSTAPHVAKIHVIVNKIWNLGDRNIKIDVYSVNDTTIKFRIRNASAKLRALRRGMWNICELPMVVSKWTPIVEDAQPEIKTMPLWVVIKNVPRSMFTWKGLSFLASPVGEPKRLHPETELVTKFDEAKFFVEVDLTKELPKACFFNIRGEEVCVTFEYPWLPLRCGVCCKWGHSEDACLTNLHQSVSLTKDTTTPAECSIPRVESIVLDIVKTSEVQSEIAQTQEDAGVTTDVVETTLGVEEGEILVSPKTGTTSPVENGEWTTVVNSGGKNTKGSGKSLTYGQVRIASPTRFDALHDANEDGEIVSVALVDITKQVGSSISEVVAEEVCTTVTTQRPEKDVGAVRVPPPRSSKQAHKYISDSSHKAKDNIPSKFYKRNSKRNL